MAKKRCKIHYPFLRLIVFLSIGLTFIFIGSSKANEPWGIHVERIEDSGGLNRCRFCGRILNPGNIHPDAEAIVKDCLKNTLTDMGIDFIEGKGSGRYIHVLIYGFVERRGGNLAVERPAGVSFHIHLFDRDNVLKRVYVYEETQQALSENVLGIGKFLRRKARWVTARELAEEGISNGLLKFQEDLR